MMTRAKTETALTKVLASSVRAILTNLEDFDSEVQEFVKREPKKPISELEEFMKGFYLLKGEAEFVKCQIDLAEEISEISLGELKADVSTIECELSTIEDMLNKV